MSLIHSLINERNRQTCAKILRKDPLEKVEWREVRSLFNELGDTAWQENGDLKVTCHGQVITLSPSPSKDVERIEDWIELRRFLEKLEQSRPLEPDEIGASARR